MLIDQLQSAQPAEPFDAVIQAGFGEHGREGLQELVDVPVLDITEAAAIVAMLIGRTYSVVTTLDRTVPMIEDRLMLAGLHPLRLDPRQRPTGAGPRRRFRSRRHRDRGPGPSRRPRRQGRGDHPRLRRHGRTRQRIQQECGVPVVDGISAAVSLAESLVAMHLSTSKIRTYAAPRPKRITGWPFTAGSHR
jgi:allantoin racemase